jgi:hypothetical protein
MKVLETIRQLLEFKDYTTIPEIAKYAELPQKYVLGVINKNGNMVRRDRKTGKIVKVVPRHVLMENLKNSGEYFTDSTYGAWSNEGPCYVILGKPFVDVPEELYNTVLTGGLGDSFYQKHIPLSSKEGLEKIGFKHWNTVHINDRLWVEDD